MFNPPHTHTTHPPTVAGCTARSAPCLAYFALGMLLSMSSSFFHVAQAQVAEPLSQMTEKLTGDTADGAVYVRTSTATANPLVYTATAANEDDAASEATNEPLTIRLKYNPANENKNDGSVGDAVPTAVTVTGLMSDANVDLASRVIGWASGYDDVMAEPVANFLRTRSETLAGQGSVPVSAEEYVLDINVASGDAAPFDVTMTLSLASVAADLFPDTDRSLGASKEDATYIIREFSDFQCPYCTRFATDVLPDIKAMVEARDDVRFEFHHFPLKSIHPNAAPAAQASECVAAVLGDDAFWPYHNALFERQRAWGSLDNPDTYFAELATDIDLLAQDDATYDELTTCIAEDTYADAVEAAYSVAGDDLKLRGTPSLFVNGFKANNPYDPEVIANLMQRVDRLDTTAADANNDDNDTDNDREE